AKVASPKPKINAAVDVAGVWPGMTYDEAANVVLCTHELLVVGPTGRTFEIQTYGQTVRHGFAAGFAKPKENKQVTARDYRRRWQDSSIAAGTNRRAQGLEPGTASWYVGTMGLPGEERVLNVARQERFEEGRQPTMESVRASLVKKYGEPTESGRDANGHMYFYWSYDLQGRLITETSPLFHQCFAPTSLNGVFKFSPDCGFAVAASLNAVRSEEHTSELQSRENLVCRL